MLYGLFIIFTMFAPFLIAVITSAIIQWFISKRKRTSMSFWLFSVGNFLLSLVLPILSMYLIVTLFGDYLEEGMGYLFMIDFMIYPFMILSNPFGMVGVHLVAEKKYKAGNFGLRSSSNKNQEIERDFDVEWLNKQPEEKKSLDINKPQIDIEFDSSWLQEENTQSHWNVSQPKERDLDAEWNGTSYQNEKNELKWDLKK